MLGPHPLREIDAQIYKSAIRAIEVGVPIYNQGDHAGCYRIYQGALFVIEPLLAHRPDLQKTVTDALAQAQTEPTIGHSAFVLRRALDRIIDDLRPDAEAPQGEQLDPAQILAGLMQCADGIERLAKVDGQDNARIRTLCGEIRDKAAFFRSKLGPKSEVPEPYRRSLEADLQLIRLALAAKTNAERLEHCEAVADDLKIKHAWAMSHDAFGLIDVTASTKDGDNEIKGLYVWYVGAGWIKIGKYIHRFDKQSSPTEARIPPGEYYVWTQRGAAQSQATPFTFGYDGQGKRSIDLPVPGGGVVPPVIVPPR